MIDEMYVPFEAAKLLQEVGFDQKCRDYYLDDGNRFGHWCNEIIPKDMAVYECPTLQIAMEWIMKRHLIFPEFRLCLGDNSEKGRYLIGVYEQTAIDTYTWQTWLYGEDYPDACRKFIEYSLKKIKADKEAAKEEDDDDE